MLNCRIVAVAACVLIGSAFVQEAHGQSGGAGLTTADYVEIQQLYARYAHTIDSGDGEGWADTFTPDGAFNDVQGHDALKAIPARAFEGSGGAQRHWNNQVLIEPTAEGARGTCYLVLMNTAVSPPAMRTGIYTDRLVKTADGWRFKERVAKFDETDQ